MLHSCYTLNLLLLGKKKGKVKKSEDRKNKFLKSFKSNFIWKSLKA